MSDGAFKALADINRREILRLLADGEMTAGEIADQFTISFASVSHHLGVLKSAGLVASERDGQHIRYRLNTTVYHELVRHLMDIFGGEPA